MCVFLLTKLILVDQEMFGYENTFYKLFEKRKKSVEHLPLDQQKKNIFSYLSYRGWEHQKIYDALNQL